MAAFWSCCCNSLRLACTRPSCKPQRTASLTPTCPHSKRVQSVRYTPLKAGSSVSPRSALTSCSSPISSNCRIKPTADGVKRCSNPCGLTVIPTCVAVCCCCLRVAWGWAKPLSTSVWANPAPVTCRWRWIKPVFLPTRWPLWSTAVARSHLLQVWLSWEKVSLVCCEKPQDYPFFLNLVHMPTLCRPPWPSSSRNGACPRWNAVRRRWHGRVGWWLVLTAAYPPLT